MTKPGSQEEKIGAEKERGGKGRKMPSLTRRMDKSRDLRSLVMYILFNVCPFRGCCALLAVRSIRGVTQRLRGGLGSARPLRPRAFLFLLPAWSPGEVSRAKTPTASPAAEAEAATARTEVEEEEEERGGEGGRGREGTRRLGRGISYHGDHAMFLPSFLNVVGAFLFTIPPL